MRGKKKTLKTAGRVLLLTVISLLIGIRLYSWNARTLAGNAMPMPFGYGISVVLSGSMEPALSENDLVIVHEQDTYEKDDIVVYQSGSILVIHRIMSIDGDTVVTQGDANNAEDDPIALSEIKGKMVARLPKIGAAGLFLKTPAGFLLAVIVAVLLFELPYRRERKKAAAEQERIKEEIKRLKDE